MCPECKFPGKCIIGMQPRPRKKRVDFCPSCLAMVSRAVSQIDFNDVEEEGESEYYSDGRYDILY